MIGVPSLSAKLFPNNQIPCSGSSPWASPSSAREQIIPRDTSPRIFRSPISKSSLSLAPTVATGTYAPSAIFTPPQRICSIIPGATSVFVTLTFVTLSSGCEAMAIIFPMTIFSSVFFRIAASISENSCLSQQQLLQLLHESSSPNSFLKKFIFVS